MSAPETVEQYLARGGRITRLPTPAPETLDFAFLRQPPSTQRRYRPGEHHAERWVHTIDNPPSLREAG